MVRKTNEINRKPYFKLHTTTEHHFVIILKLKQTNTNKLTESKQQTF